MKGEDEMKKSYLIEGVVFFVGGLALLGVALFTDTVLDSLLFGFASGAACAGLVSICRYFYWKAPANAEQYQERMAKEKIELHDELKVKLRDRSGRYAYVLGLLAVSASMMVFSILGKLDIVGDSRIIVLYLGGYLVFQVVAGSAIYRHLLKKY